MKFEDDLVIPSDQRRCHKSNVGEEVFNVLMVKLS
jgi:hypothetical protein